MKRRKRNPRNSSRASSEALLRNYKRTYERLKAGLRELGYVCLGSIAKRWLTCGQPTCSCHRSPTQRHGPYYHWTRKVANRTESRMLPESLVRLYREGIRNHRRLDVIVERMRAVSLLALEAVKKRSQKH